MTAFRSPIRLRLALCALACIGLSEAALADPIEDFYRGKTIQVLIGVNYGGGYDLEARLVSKFIGAYIPGHPNVVAQNMVGAGGITMMNYLANVAPKDGTYIGMVPTTLIAMQAVQGQGVNFDADKFFWIGSPEHTTDLIYSWSDSGVHNVAEARQKQVIAASSAKGAITYTVPEMMNEVLGTKFKIITGYQGSSTMTLALERREADVAVDAWPALKTRKPEWFAEKKVSVLAHSGKTAVGLDGVPSFEDLAANDDDRRVVALVLSGDELGRPLALPPGVPADRVKALRDAFQATIKDKDYLKDAANAGFEIQPISGEELQSIVAKVLATPKNLVARAKAIIAPE
jgi:tripartite-type tricarboxylate transporter receptor subunit TctC